MKDSIINQIQGTWLLISIKAIYSNGETADMYDNNPRGISMFSANGYANVQMGSSVRPRFKTDSINNATLEEIAFAYKTYMAFYGRYTEKAPGTLAVQIEDCLFPNWIGKEIIRYAEINGDLLTLSTPEMNAGTDNYYVKAIWQKT